METVRLAPRLNSPAITTTAKVKIIPLGGLGEIGKNLMVYEYKDEIMIVDIGIAFPGKDLLGIDSVIPDIKYLEDNKQKIRGIVLTHGHEDHIGSLPLLWPKLGCPIFATTLTAGLLQNKFEEHGIHPKVTIIKAGDILPIGPFKVEFIAITHSVPDALILAINSPSGMIMHATDWKIDHTPVNGKVGDWGRIAELGKKGVNLLLSESTNVERPGYTVSESVIGESLDMIFKNAKGRVIVTSFGSLINRIQQVIDASANYRRKIAIAGRSMENNVEIAAKLGFLRLPQNTLVDIRKLGKLPDDEVTIMCTGSQGEEFSALTRMAAGEHRHVQIKRGDTIIISASPIPGNEAAIAKTIDNLFRQGADVIYGKDYDVHVSGHASQEELKMMIDIVKPKFFMPIHGDYRFLVKHCQLAQSLGIPEKNTFVLENGDVLELSPNEAKKAGYRVPAGEILVDGSGIGDVGNIVLRDRQAMSKDGFFVVILTVDHTTKKTLTSPDIISRGFVYMREVEELIKEARKLVVPMFNKLSIKYRDDWARVKQEIRDQMGNFLFERTQRKPMVIPVIIEVGKPKIGNGNITQQPIVSPSPRSTNPTVYGPDVTVRSFGE
ncbi:MAG: ribonuclease J [Patescibacteria group bacterium]|jgi:ribonuclease J